MTNKENGLLPCREAFEKWYGSRPDFGKYCYTDQIVQARWEAWQAAWSTRAQPQDVDGDVAAALTIFDEFCSFIDGLHMGGFVENDFMSKAEQKTIRAALTARQPDVNMQLLECLNDAINLWDAQNPLNPDDINKWREVSKQSKENIEYIADAIVKAIADILYLSHTYEKIGKFNGTIDELTIVLNRLGLNEDDDSAEQKGG